MGGEGAIINQEIYDSAAHNTKFIPIFFDQGDAKYIPTILRSSTQYDARTKEGYDNLYRQLTAQPATPPPPVGELRELPALSRSTSALPSTDNSPLYHWLKSVKRDHSTLVHYFQKKANFSFLSPVYVRLTLYTHDRPIDLLEALRIRPEQHGWVTRRWVVRGDPGAGKTTLLRHQAAMLANDEEREWVPIFETLPRLIKAQEQGSPKPLFQRFEDRLLNAGTSEARGLADLLKQEAGRGHLLILLDGLDEVPRDHRSTAKELLRDLSGRWPKTPIVVTTRPIGYERPGPEFVELDLLPLDGDCRREFLARWFGRHSGKLEWKWAQKAAADLEETSALTELSANPLYLTLMALLIEQDIPPANNLTNLYGQVFKMLLDGKHKPDPEPIDAQELVRSMLRYISYAMTLANRDGEPQESLERRLFEPDANKLLKSIEQIWRPRRWGSRRFLDDVAEKTGILGPHDGEDSDWRFWHRTFREALTAEELKELAHRDGREKLLDHARNIKGDEGRWAEPYALLVGLVDDSDELIKNLVESNKALGLRALATAQGIADATIDEILQLTDTWKERTEVYKRVPDIVNDAERSLALLDRLRRRTRNGNDLFFIDRAIAEVGRRWRDFTSRARDLQRKMYDHIPPPPEKLFTCIETPRDGKSDLWRMIPAGEVRIGSSAGEGLYTEKAQYLLAVASPFWMMATPVTCAQYEAFNPKHRSKRSLHNPEEEWELYPVNSVTWYAAVSFCRWLETWLPGTRLPTEEEWEYACRARTHTRYWSGESKSDLTKAGWFKDNSDLRTHKVGEKPESPWGLYDMHGNVFEWTLSLWTPDYSRLDAVRTINPVGEEILGASVAPEGDARVIRGGSFCADEDKVRSAYRESGDPARERWDRGFRIMSPYHPKQWNSEPQ